jgi:cell division protein FtsB
METTFDEGGQNTAVPLPRRPRRKRRRKIVLGLLPRLLLVVSAAIIMLLATAAFVAKIARPYQIQHTEAKQIDQESATLSSYEAANRDLQAKIDYLKRPDGIENAARSQDWVKRGEISLEISIAPPAAPANHEQSGFAGIIRRAWQNLTAKS